MLDIGDEGGSIFQLENLFALVAGVVGEEIEGVGLVCALGRIHLNSVEEEHADPIGLAKDSSAVLQVLGGPALGKAKSELPVAEIDVLHYACGRMVGKRMTSRMLSAPV